MDDMTPDPPKDDERERFSPATRERISRRIIEYLRAERDEALKERDAAYARGRAVGIAEAADTVVRSAVVYIPDPCSFLATLAGHIRALAPGGEYVAVRAEALRTRMQRKPDYGPYFKDMAAHDAWVAADDELRAALPGGSDAR